MTKNGTAIVRILLGFCAGTLAWGQSPGHVNYFKDSGGGFDTYLNSPTTSTQQWIYNNIAGMKVFAPYFDTKTSWYPNGYVYWNFFGIDPNSWVRYNHPEWILHDQNGNWLYIPFNCSGGKCSTYAGDIANPAFRAWWINNIQSVLAGGGYTHLFIDDVDMEFRVANGNGTQVPPIDTNTGALMTYTAWRSYVAAFAKQIRAALPNTKIMHNSIWFADATGSWVNDSYVQQQLGAADYVNLERGVASDAGLTGGTGFWSVYNFFSYVDKLHAMGKGVNLMAYSLTTAQQQYNLASYYMISTGKDYVTDNTATPSNWWTGYNTELGTPAGARTYSNGIFKRVFSGGIVLLAEPGLGSTTIQLGATYHTLTGNSVTSVTMGGSQGLVLLGTTTSGTPSAPAPPPTGGGIARYISDIAPSYSVNGWGNVQINKSTNGTPLTVNGVVYAHGLGAHAYAEQRWPLYANCSTLTATVGVDDEVPAGTGNVTFQVWGDGRLLYNSGYMQGGSKAQSVNVSVAGVQTLGLVVTNGTYMAPSWTTGNDHSDWANPVITCAN